MKSYIPTINISSLLDKNFKSVNAKKTIKKIEKACVEVGFFQITNHGIKKKNIDDIAKVGKYFFNSSAKNKLKLAPKKWNNLNTNIYRGYFPADVNGKDPHVDARPSVFDAYLLTPAEKGTKTFDVSNIVNI